MARNQRRLQQQANASKPVPVTPTAVLSKRGKKLMLFAIGLVFVGYWVLTYTDPAGQNWASTLSPALLVLGYSLIGVGIVLPDPVSPNSPQK